MTIFTASPFRSGPSSRTIFYIVIKKVCFSFVLLLITTAGTFAQCGGVATDGNSFSDIGNGPGIVAWLNPQNAQYSDDVRAITTATVTNSSPVVTHYLYVRNLNFNVPSNISVCGLEVVIEHRKHGGNSSSSAKDNIVQLATNSNLSVNYAKSIAWSDTDEVFVYGGPSDLWGRSWTASDINSTSFGVNITTQMQSTATATMTAEIDHVYINLYYSSVLPVELASFSAEARENERAVLDWTTATETNSDYFTIEKSSNGRDFDRLTEVKAAGYSQQMMYYRYVDYHPYAGVSYYRLKQVDKNGAYKIYPARSVSFASAGTMNLTSVPGSLIIHLQAENNMPVEVQIWNMFGQRVRSIQQLPEENETTIRIVTNDLSPGIYIVRAASGHSEFSAKTFVQRE